MKQGFSPAYARFGLRVLAFLALAAGLAGTLLYERWGGIETFYCFGWAVACSVTLAVFGYRSLRLGIMSRSPNEAMKHLFGGMLLRFAILVGTHLVVFSIFGAEWGRRALTATTALYVIALAFEVFTVQQELQAMSRRRAQEGDASNKGSVDFSTKPPAAAQGR